MQETAIVRISDLKFIRKKESSDGTKYVFKFGIIPSDNAHAIKVKIANVSICDSERHNITSLIFEGGGYTCIRSIGGQLNKRSYGFPYVEVNQLQYDLLQKSPFMNFYFEIENEKQQFFYKVEPKDLIGASD